MMAASRGWIAATLGLALVVGLSAGVLLDRFVLTGLEMRVASGPRAAERDGARDSQDASRDRGDDRHREPLLDRLTRELQLSEAQTRDLEQVLASNAERARQYWSQSRGQYDALREEFREAIRGVLTDEQRARFDDMLTRGQQRRDERRRRQSDERD
jgi:hypothetical protein